jgi:transposase
MTGFISGADRAQGTMFPAQLEDYVAEDNPVRVIDLFVDQLDLGQLGFWRVSPKLTGRPAYDPAVMLKLYIYGYLNRVQSSRRLERECQRNVEVMWLTGRLAPDFKTIADFRKDDGPAIRKVCREFIVVCGRAGLLAAKTVAIDGSKFKAVNSRDRNFTKAKIAKRLEQIEASIERYLSELETADRQPSTPEIKITRLNGKIAKLKQQIERMKAVGAELSQAEETQISLTDPGANRFAVCRATPAPCKEPAKRRESLAITCSAPWKPSTTSSSLTKSPTRSMTVISFPAWLERPKKLSAPKR